MMIAFHLLDDIPGLAVALVEIHHAKVGPAPEELQQLSQRCVHDVVSSGWATGERRKTKIRDLLRSGGFKPSGRNKPAQEYLFRTASRDGALPAIFNAVDLLNVISLQSGLPISLISLDRVGDELALRWGTPGEAYVFNRTGQELSVQGLICACEREGDSFVPVGSPVKDSMRAKVAEEDGHLLALFYASQEAISRDELERWANELGEGALKFCGASRFEVQMLPEAWEASAER